LRPWAKGGLRGNLGCWRCSDGAIVLAIRTCFIIVLVYARGALWYETIDAMRLRASCRQLMPLWWRYCPGQSRMVSKPWLLSYASGNPLTCMSARIFFLALCGSRVSPCHDRAVGFRFSARLAVMMASSSYCSMDSIEGAMLGWRVRLLYETSLGWDSRHFVGVLMAFSS
jgi:hypothetical protein